jgi:hypothetical protein
MDVNGRYVHGFVVSHSLVECLLLSRFAADDFAISPAEYPPLGAAIEKVKWHDAPRFNSRKIAFHCAPAFSHFENQRSRFALAAARFGVFKDIRI